MGKILVVDDEPTIVSIIEDVLQLNGFPTFSAADAEEADKAVKSSRPDLILLDVMLPKMDGFTFCENLRKDPANKDIPVIFVTVMNKESDLDRAKKLGAIDFIAKPFDPAKLVASVKKALAK